MIGAGSLIERITHFVLVTLCASALTAGFFFLLPLIQEITQPPEPDSMVRAADTMEEEKPPETEEPEEPEKEEEQEEEKPQLAEESQPLDLSQLELALNPGFGDGFGAADFVLNVGGAGAGGGADVEELFSADDLDEIPRCVYQPAPVLDAKLRKHTPGTVYVIFEVNPSGRVERPRAQKSTDPALERAAVNAVKQWKFEPGRRKGEAVKFKMRCPITFPES